MLTERMLTPFPRFKNWISFTRSGHRWLYVARFFRYPKPKAVIEIKDVTPETKTKQFNSVENNFTQTFQEWRWNMAMQKQTALIKTARLFC